VERALAAYEGRHEGFCARVKATREQLSQAEADKVRLTSQLQAVREQKEKAEATAKQRVGGRCWVCGCRGCGVRVRAACAGRDEEV